VGSNTEEDGITGIPLSCSCGISVPRAGAGLGAACTEGADGLARHWLPIEIDSSLVKFPFVPSWLETAPLMLSSAGRVPF
jgi:hypothetical protein